MAGDFFLIRLSRKRKEGKIKVYLSFSEVIVCLVGILKKPFAFSLNVIDYRNLSVMKRWFKSNRKPACV